MVEEQRPTLKPPPAWRVWDNPLLRRYLRSQLRWRELLTWVVLMLSVCAWMTLAIYGYILREEKVSPQFAARCAWVPLLFLQAFILLFQGTSAVASGIVREGMDGMVRYQRLTPLAPLTKTLGYLLGLPIRAWVLFFLTLPFAVWLCTQGRIPLEIWAPIYGVMLSTALLYHLTGLLLGLVIPQGAAATKVASFLSYLLVSLYLLLPNLGHFGLLLFQYLTVRPVFFHKLYELDPELFELLPFRAGLDENHTAVVPFFAAEFSEVGYTFLIQGLLGAVFFVVLLRRWRDEHANPLGKLWAPVLCAGLQLLLLGNALPSIDRSDFLRAPRHLAQFNPLVRALDTPVARAYLIAAVYGLVSLTLAAILLHVTIAPRQRMDSALRRALRAGRRVPFLADGARSGWVALLLGLITAAGWQHFNAALFSAPRLAALLERAGLSAQEVIASLDRLWLIPPVTLLIMWLLLEGFGRRAWSLFSLSVWVLPTMVGTLVLIWQGSAADWALHLIAVSPIGQVGGGLLPVLGQALDHWWVAELARWAQIWIVAHAAFAFLLWIWVGSRNHARRKRLRAELVELPPEKRKGLGKKE